MHKHFFLICVLILFYCKTCLSTQDSSQYYSNVAENHFLKGEIDSAIANYTKALDYSFRSDYKEANQSRKVLKLVELLALSLRETGNCNRATDYLKKHLSLSSDKAMAAKAIAEILRCNSRWGIKLDAQTQNAILEIYSLTRIDEAENIQFSDFLNGAYSDDNEFDNFFYLLENGFVPALESMDKELQAKKMTSVWGWLITVAIFLIAGLGFFLYTMNKRKEHVIKENVALLKGKEKETSRLSIDLHDILGYKIVELKDQVGKLVNHPTDELQKVADGLDELHESMRFIVQSNLTPESLKFGLAPALDTLLNRVNKLGVIRFDLYKHGLDERLQPELEKQVFYIIQELVNNVIKHSKGSSSTVEVSKLAKEVSIIVEDNGIGYLPSLDTLKTVKARTSFLKGKVIEESQLDKGTTIIVSIPL